MGDETAGVAPALLPAVHAAADALGAITADPESRCMSVAKTVLRAAVDAGAIVPRRAYDALAADLSRLERQHDGVAAQLERLGTKYATLENLTHRMAEGSSIGPELYDEYRRFPWQT